jgi:4-amino-4-deoxy-L-arabinose transferase-like glycosyltransferase
MIDSSVNGPPLFRNAGKPIGVLLLLVMLGALGALLFVPGLGTVHLFDWDEANFAEASREMMVRDNYLQVTIDYRPFYEKPPLFFWLQVLSMKAFGVNEFAARFVNALCGIATIIAVFLIGRRIYSTLFGFLWALAFLGSFLPHFFFKSGIIDPLFNLLIFCGLTVAAKGLLSEKRKQRIGWSALAGVFIGLATLAKGPVAILIICLTMLVYWAFLRFRVIFRLPDIIAFFACIAAVACIFFGIETFSHGTVFIKKFIAYQLRLFSTGDAGHGRPFYFHFLVILFGCFPASFFAIFSFTKRNEPAAPQQVFNRLMIILFWVVLVLFSIVKTKTVLYSSLTWFPVTYCAALFLSEVIEGRKAFTRPLFISLACFASLVCLAITFFPVLIIHTSWIVPLIHDKFAVACLANPVHWSGYEFLLGIGYGCAMAVSLLLIAKKRFLAGAVGIFGAGAACVFLFMFVFAFKIEQYSQGGPIAFYQAHAGENAYVRSLFKSYTDLFYSRKKPYDTAGAKSYDENWLLRGPIDKPAYFVARVTQSKPYEDPSLGLVKLASEYGFVYYRRDVPGNIIDKLK